MKCKGELLNKKCVKRAPPAQFLFSRRMDVKEKGGGPVSELSDEENTVIQM